MAPSRPSARKKPTTTRIRSDVPTIVIAPSDYVHIYQGSGKPAPREPAASDFPTALVAPDDYQNYFDKRTRLSREGQRTKAWVEKVKKQLSPRPARSGDTWRRLGNSSARGTSRKTNSAYGSKSLTSVFSDTYETTETRATRTRSPGANYTGRHRAHVPTLPPRTRGTGEETYRKDPRSGRARRKKTKQLSTGGGCGCCCC